MSSEKSTFECVVSADLFRRALGAVSTEETRYYLQGVHVSPAPDGGAVICATNGSFLIALHDPDAYVEGQGIVLLNKQMKSALKVSGMMLEKRLLIVRQASEQHRAFVVDLATRGADDEYSPYAAARDLFDAPDKRVQAAQFGAVTIDGTFPDWRRVVPSRLRPDAPLPVIDQALLSRAAEALSTDQKRRSVRVTCSGEVPANDPVLVTSDEFRGVAGFAIIMPVRSNDKAAAVPTWALIPTAQAA